MVVQMWSLATSLVGVKDMGSEMRSCPFHLTTLSFASLGEEPLTNG